jgi:hypothetical protein
MSQSMNIRAVQWAYEQDDLNVTAKAVLITFAMHANERGYSWPGVERIASKWGMDRETVRRQIEVLLVRRKIYGTKKKCGATGQVKVYRLPKSTWGSGGKCRSFGNVESGGIARDKRGVSGGKSTPNNEHDEQRTKKNNELISLTNSTLAAPDKVSCSLGFVFEGHQHQNQSAKDHVKWSEFVAYCVSEKGKPAKDGRIHDGIPREDGFWKWLLGQDPYWRDKVKPRDQIDGFVLGDTFYPADEANRLGRENPDFLTQFRKAVRRDGKIEIIRS